MLRPPTSWLTMLPAAGVFSRDAPSLRICCYPVEEVGSMSAIFTGPFMPYPGRSVCVGQPTGMDLGCMICAIGSPFGRYCDGIGLVMMSSGACRSSQPIWVTCTSAIRIGTSVHGPNSCRRRCVDSNDVGRNGHDDPLHRLGAASAAFLHWASDRATAGKPAHHYFLSRHVPNVAEVHPTTTR